MAMARSVMTGPGREGGACGWRVGLLGGGRRRRKGSDAVDGGMPPPWIPGGIDGAGAAGAGPSVDLNGDHRAPLAGAGGDVEVDADADRGRRREARDEGLGVRG